MLKETALFECARYGKYDAFNVLAIRFDPYKTDFDWNTPYDIAISAAEAMCGIYIIHYMFHFNEMNEVLYNVVEMRTPSTEILKKLCEKQIVTFDEPQEKSSFRQIKHPLSYRPIEIEKR